MTDKKQLAENSNMEHKIEQENNKLKKILLKKPVRYAISAVLILAVVGAGIAAFQSNGKSGDIGNVAPIKKVKTVTLEKRASSTESINAVGMVRAETAINAVSSGRGTIKTYFAVGEKVSAGQLLASLDDSATVANSINAQTNYNNLQNSLESVKLLSRQTVKQAEIAIQGAEKTVAGAEIALKSARENLLNYDAIKTKNLSDAERNAVISFASPINIILEALNRANDILPISNEIQLSGLKETLGAKNLSTVNIAKTRYETVSACYSTLENKNPIESSIASDLSEMAPCLEQSRTLIDEVIAVLNNTAGSAAFPDSAISAQLSILSGTRANISASITAAKREIQALENFGLSDAQQIANLKNAILAAENNLSAAKINRANSLAALESAKQAGSQQVLGAEAALDGARSQVNLANIQVADLYVKAPISGQVTKKLIETGAEARIGDMVAEISQAKVAIIDIDLSESDLAFIKTGQKARINARLTGQIGRIYPSADAITKKIRVEIIFDNKNGELLAGSFADVSLSKNIGLGAENSAIYIPLSALIINQNEKFVFLSVTNTETGTITAKKTAVTTGKTDGADIEIASGLKFGDTLITEGAKNLKDNEIIEINYAK